MTNFSDMLSKAKIMQEKMREAQDKIKKIEVNHQVFNKILMKVLMQLFISEASFNYLNFFLLN